MKLTAEKKLLTAALSRIQGITEKTSIKPVTSQALIKTHGDMLMIAATNLQIGIQETYKKITVAEEGAVAVNARMLFDIVREMPEGLISIEEKENYTIEINSGKKVKFKISGSSPEDFPQLFKKNEKDFIALDAKKLLNMMNLTAFSMSRDESTQNINGAFLENIENGCSRMVTTDGYRLSVVDETFNVVIPLAEGIIIPYKAVVELHKTLQEKKEEKTVYLQTDGKILCLRIAEIEFNISLIEKKFPDYRVIIPGDGYKLVEIFLKREEIIPALKRMAIISSENNRPVVFSFKEMQLEMKSEDSDRGMVKEKIGLSTAVSQDVLFCINCGYLLDILLAAEDDVLIQYNIEEENKPIVIRPEKNKEKVKYIVMPMLMD